MIFDIPNLHIEPESTEGQGLQAIMTRDHVSPEEAVRRALRGISVDHGDTRKSRSKSVKKPGELLFGLFADDPELMASVIEDSRAWRDREIVKDIGV